VWDEAQRAMTAVLRSATIDDMARYAPNGTTSEIHLDDTHKN